METKQKPYTQKPAGQRKSKPRQISYRTAGIKSRGKRKYKTLREWAEATLTKAHIKAWRERECRMGLDDDLDGGVYKAIQGYKKHAGNQAIFSRQTFLAYCQGQDIATDYDVCS